MNIIYWNYIQQKILHFENSSLWKFFQKVAFLKEILHNCEELLFFRMWKNFILIYLILISPYWNSSQSEELCFFRMWWIWSWHPETSDPDIWYQILILGIGCWSWVSDPDTAYQDEILHNCEEFFFFTIVKNFFSSESEES